MFFSIIRAFYHIAIIAALVMYCMAIVGLELFHNVEKPSEIGQIQRPNSWEPLLETGLIGFDSMGSALLTAFQLFLAQNFTEAALVYTNQFGSVALVYFMVGVILGQMLLSNLFIGMVVDAFVFKSQKAEIDEHERQLWKRAKAHEELNEDGMPFCWICLQDLLAVQRPIEPFDTCECCFHRKCILTYEYKRGICPKCRVTNAFENPELNFEVNKSLEQQMFGDQLAFQLDIGRVLESQGRHIIENMMTFEGELKVYMHNLGYTCIVSTPGGRILQLPPVEVDVAHLSFLLRGVITRVWIYKLSTEPDEWSLGGGDNAQEPRASLVIPLTSSDNVIRLLPYHEYLVELVDRDCISVA